MVEHLGWPVEQESGPHIDKAPSFAAARGGEMVRPPCAIRTLNAQDEEKLNGSVDANKEQTKGKKYFCR
jgi:hypothetical protein